MEGPKFGYFPEPEKSYLVVHPDFVEIAKEKFADFKVNIVTSHRFLEVLLEMRMTSMIGSAKKLTFGLNQSKNFQLLLNKNPNLPILPLQNLYNVNGLSFKE